MKLVYVAQIIIAVILVLVVLLQGRGASGGLGGIFGGGGSSTFRTRRGIEKTLFRFTIILIVVFVVIAMISVRLT